MRHSEPTIGYLNCEPVQVDVIIVQEKYPWRCPVCGGQGLERGRDLLEDNPDAPQFFSLHCYHCKHRDQPYTFYCDGEEYLYRNIEDARNDKPLLQYRTMNLHEVLKRVEQGFVDIQFSDLPSKIYWKFTAEKCQRFLERRNLTREDAPRSWQALDTVAAYLQDKSSHKDVLTAFRRAGTEIDRLPDNKKLIHDPYGSERMNNRYWANTRLRELIDDYIKSKSTKGWREEGEEALFEDREEVQ